MPGRLACAAVEHEAVAAWCDAGLAVDCGPGDGAGPRSGAATGQFRNRVVQSLPQGLADYQVTQGFGKLPVAFNWLGCEMGLVSAHKLGGPKGVGALVLRRGLDVAAQLKGGGQEMGRRAGTENLIGIAGFAAAAEAAARDLADGV